MKFQLAELTKLIEQTLQVRTNFRLNKKNNKKTKRWKVESSKTPIRMNITKRFKGQDNRFLYAANFCTVHTNLGLFFIVICLLVLLGVRLHLLSHSILVLALKTQNMSDMNSHLYGRDRIWQADLCLFDLVEVSL